MAEKKSNTITLPSWLSFGNVVTIVMMLGAAAGVYAGVVSNTAVQAERIATVIRDQKQLRDEQEKFQSAMRRDMGDVRDDVRRLTAHLLDKGK